MTLVTLENICRVLLNLIKRLMFVMYKSSFPLNVHAVNIHILFNSPVTAGSRSKFVLLPYLFG